MTEYLYSRHILVAVRYRSAGIQMGRHFTAKVRGFILISVSRPVHKNPETAKFNIWCEYGGDKGHGLGVIGTDRTHLGLQGQRY